MIEIIFDTLKIAPKAPLKLHYFLRKRNAFEITDTELKLIAAAAIIGLNNIPKNGNKIPAAIGTPIELYTNAKNKFCLMFRMT